MTLVQRMLRDPGSKAMWYAVAWWIVVGAYCVWQWRAAWIILLGIGVAGATVSGITWRFLRRRLIRNRSAAIVGWLGLPTLAAGVVGASLALRQGIWVAVVIGIDSALGFLLFGPCFWVVRGRSARGRDAGRG